MHGLLLGKGYMDYNEVLNYIHSLERFGSRPGLERIEKLLFLLGDPQKDLRFIHVAGTNGKGSTCAMTASALKKAGYKTGLYISPYITCFRERIQVNGEYISEEDLAVLTKKVKDTGIEVTEFEFITAVAFLYFKMQRCDVVVLETGLGGRLDATNVIPAPLSAVITGIDKDHTGVLGDTIEKIAAEKCGIIKSGCLVFTTHSQKPEAMRVIKSFADPITPDPSKLSVIKSDLSGNEFIYKGEKYSTTLIGKHQIENALLAIEILKGCTLPMSLEDIKSGISETVFPARLELISKSPIVMLDGAHNPHGAAALAEEMRKHKNVTLITGMMADKDCEQVMSIIASCCKRVITVTVNENLRSIPAEELALLASNYCDDVCAAQSYREALEKTTEKDTVFIAGSLYLAGGIRELAINFYN